MMLKKGTSRIIITAALLSINILIFLYRDHGFEYRDYLSAAAAGAICDEACINKWTKPNSAYPAKELAEARQLLREEIRIDSLVSSEEKIITIGAWLREELSKQTGQMNDSVNALPTLQQYYCFKNNRQFSYDCGNVQTLFSFFCTAAELPCRNFQNIQLPSDSLAHDSHVANEIYLEKYQKWVLSDPFQNHLLVKKNNIPLSAAEYLDYNIAGGQDTVTFIQQVAGLPQAVSVNPAEFKRDTYFNKNYILHFYKENPNQQVYSFRNKLKRYFWPYSWYEIYAPQQKNTNFLFRIKQIAALLLGGWLIFMVTGIVRKEKK